ncbi:hypothetical protein P170DRAFT_346625 [Aspergillus steynii IBT 23096]|uniref:Subtelomeric hrmA-associated cluster protein AFUB-079030/YDR124W-like helical bundle domain-containing protein n=1 Tax=Aspergillus steynii IBT 23096 TaxID=1392250 RepID=A0A2I2GLE5_9EURO|nr:uncharacterized protein P170DRAFT_346625 [Aspergillus steynii IBT 23096]PLB53679.1 hypothetical protein P170DRAFT_346625 [Aspergillus steynii IBT 23096]
MVVNASVSGTGAVKRPASSLHDDYVGWEHAPSMGTSMRSSMNLPYPHYALIYLDTSGKLKVSESSSIREQNGTVFTPEVRERFLEVLGTRIGYHKPMLRRVPGIGLPAYGYGRPEEFTRQRKRRRSSYHNAALDYPDPVEELPPASTTNMIGLEIGDEEKVLEYYENALKHFQQINCRLIAKAFIKFIEPRKQVKHPYNGGKPRGTGQKGDPEKTKPEWWPAGVNHKEPDHLRKDQRVALLVHILRKLDQSGITPEKLQEVAHDARRQLKPPEKIEIFDEIFRVRRMEQRYERGEVDATTVVYVLNRDSSAKGEKDADAASEPDPKMEETDEEEETDDEFLTPSSSAEQASSSFTSTVDMGLTGQGSDRNQLFSLSEPIGLGEQSRHERSFYSTSSEYANDYSSPNMIKPPPTTLVSPNEQTQSFDYLTPAPFSTSAGDQMVAQRPSAMPMQHSVSQFDAWTPSFRQNMFDPLEYGNTTGQTVTQSHLPYQMPMAHTSDITHGLPELRCDKSSHMDPLSFRSSTYRTGSMGHSHMGLSRE